MLGLRLFFILMAINDPRYQALALPTYWYNATVAPEQVSNNHNPMLLMMSFKKRRLVVFSFTVLLHIRFAVMYDEPLYWSHALFCDKYVATAIYTDEECYRKHPA